MSDSARSSGRPSGRASATLALAAVLVAACSTVASPVGPYPVSRAPSYPGGPFEAGPRFLSAPPSQCVPFAREISGIAIRGDANTWWTQAEGRYERAGTPAVGSVIVIRTYGDGSRGHVAVVTRIVSDRVILVDHANWHGRGEVAVAVPVRDVSEDHNWSQVNVWWLDTNRWGSRDYTVEGFIRPR
ncbi:MAG: CHAP domain-containing protein [Hyphomonadaceae bacterium]|nr:MAG: surface antigen [Caulobacteraceae bacterium]MBT9444147.1 CHAP domain-containing protein [Hyphomonadaceae bacterium]TPW04889.1 MAG: surface antigen [Alphaproteobacteria bacterium]